MGITSAQVEALAYVASIHEVATHTPQDAATARAYSAFARETVAQFEALCAQGMRFVFTDAEPYFDSKSMRADVDAGTLRVYTGGDLPADHPLAQHTLHGVSVNSLFRATHDVLGHARTGNGFGPQGELQAFMAHAKAYSDDAFPALAAETLAQNAWVNYGPHNPQALPARLRPYAPQKAYAFPFSVAKSF